MARKRTQKAVSARIDSSYVRRRHPWRALRRTTVFVCSALAVLIVVLASGGEIGGRLTNPGRLTFVHAKFQNNCGACHDGCDESGKPTSAFSLAVSDAACLKCHDGAVHNVNQATMVMLDVHRKPSGPRSADCASCHTEHRGQSALVSSNDIQCVSCHSDLTGKTIDPPGPTVAMHVTAFTIADHPGFGAQYRTTGKFVDPSNLRFNHEKHYSTSADGKPLILAGTQRNCTWCHDPNADAGIGLKWESGKNSVALPGGMSGPPTPLDDGTADHRSLTQVNYDKNCKACHDLGTLPNSDIAIPHGNMSEVRQVILAYCRDRSAAFLKYAKDSPGAKEKPLNDRMVSKLSENVPADFADQMAALTKAVKADPLSPYLPLSDPGSKLPPDLAERLVTVMQKLPVNIVAKKDHESVREAILATTQPVAHLRPLLIDRLRLEALKGLSGERKTAMQLAFDAAISRYDEESPDPRLLEVYVTVANDSGTNCEKCHDLDGSIAAVPPEWAGMQMVAKPVTDDNIFCTRPTGIPAGPRRWYTNSVFNHDAHRSMNCVECHATIAQSADKTNTVSVFVPDIQWQGLAFTADGQSMVAATRSCVECHHPDDANGLGAASNCTECHVYHDRSHELQPKPTPTDVLNGKLAASGGPVALGGQ